MTLKVKDLMSSDLETVFADETMDLANTVMTMVRIRRLPVVDRGRRLIGRAAPSDRW